ncbi:hypothetical protein DSM106972_092600 [Dulcicalothrix desertica PCC 7102]|uniref:Multidrug resistance protein MdtA-like barrel-sandwich hybrid domain-containing protein n=1 Tax=Dulcicalothrix desertica PCC 7102 TaxID=232991 RepID=A0A433ULK1_9CYAN|nr:NHLP bacteriocin system secretion protein [Dulcicalothrix desertica]RUS94725.1 hypothetical protein DSM106972_092600 [Dulcicalothrix desertica PCC 7102]TWH51320.1 HlyD family secretion protein [Dulcicalothrix desertica PCC 7102]
MSKDKLFRQESLERLSSPERLDQLMQIVNPKDWLPLTTLGVFVVGTLIWSIFGRIPITENAPGVVILPKRVTQFQSNIPGQLKTVNVKEGQCVDKGYVLATIDPPELKQQLEQQRAKRGQLLAQSQDSGALQGERAKLEKETLASERLSLLQRLEAARQLTPILKDQDLKIITQQRQSLEQRLQYILTLTPALKNKASNAIAQEKLSIQQRLRDFEALVPVHKQRLEKRQQLLAEGAITADSVLQVEQEYRQALQLISDTRAQLKQLDVKETESQQQYLTNINSISEIQVQLKDLSLKQTQAQQKYLDNINGISQLQNQLQEVTTKAKRLEQENLSTSNNRINEIKEVERNIAYIEAKIGESSQIISKQAGCILEVTSSVGQFVNAGFPIATMNAQGEGGKMLAITYFPVKDGKKMKRGMSVQITPDTVKRERFGGVVGKVVSVSSFPITPEGAFSVLGNAELVKKLTAQEPTIEVTAELELDESTYSGYKWSSSKGPQLKISPGTTTTARVQVEQQAPITFVLPILKEWTGIN